VARGRRAAETKARWQQQQQQQQRVHAEVSPTQLQRSCYAKAAPQRINLIIICQQSCQVGSHTFQPACGYVACRTHSVIRDASGCACTARWRAAAASMVAVACGYQMSTQPIAGTSTAVPITYVLQPYLALQQFEQHALPSDLFSLRADTTMTL